jgi:hypothetical protein
MKKVIYGLLPYVGAPVIGAALFIVHMGRADLFVILLYELLIVFAYAAAVLDIKSRKVPNGLLLAMFAAWAVVMTAKLFSDTEPAIALLQSAALGFAVGGGLFLLLAAGFIFYAVMKIIYLGTNLRHDHEAATESAISNLTKEDIFIKKVTRSKQSSIGRYVYSNEAKSKGKIDSIAKKFTDRMKTP